MIAKKIDKPSRLVLTPLIDLLINNNNMHESQCDH